MYFRLLHAFRAFISQRRMLAVLGVAAIGSLLWLSPVHAVEVMGTVASLLASIAQILIELIGKVFTVLIEILLAVVQYNDFINAPAVVKGWVLVRDVSNMAFLIIFIAIAFATILGVEKYEYKQLLPKLLVMAVLINFSRTICGLVIDAAQVVMITFVNGFKDVAAGNLIRGFGISEMLTLRDLGEGEGVSGTALAAASILAVAMLAIATVTVGIMVLMFIVRIIYLWILIVLSPFAFVLSATPGFSGKFNEWWDKFTRYVFVGPLLAFFLWLSFSIMASVQPGQNLATQNNINFGGTTTLVEGSIGAVGRTSAAITEVSRSDNLLSFGIAIALLLMALTTANSIGVAGGKLAGSAMAKIQSGGIKLGKIAGLTLATGGIGTAVGALAGYKVGKWAGKKGVGLAREKTPGLVKRWVQDISTREGAGMPSRLLKYTTKEAWEGFFARGKQKQRWAAEKAAGQAREEADLVFTGVKQIPHTKIAEHKIEQELVKEYEQFSKEPFMHFAEQATKVKGIEGQRMRKALVLSAGNKGYLDDLMSQPMFRERYVGLGKEKYGYQDGTFYNDTMLNEFLYDYLEGVDTAGTGRGQASQDTMRVMDDLEDLGRRTNHWEYLGHSNYKTDTGQYRATEVSARANEENFAVDVNGNKIQHNGHSIRTVTTDAQGKKVNALRFDAAKKAWMAKDENDQDIELQGAVLQQMRWQNADQQAFAIGEMQKLGARDKGRAAPHNFVSLRYDQATGQTLREGAFTEFQLAALEAMGGEVSREVQHTQARLKEWFFGTTSVGDDGAVESLTHENLEKIIMLNAKNPTIMKNLFALLANDRDATSGFSVEQKDADGNVAGERIFGDKNAVRTFQKKRIVENMEALVPEIEEARQKGDTQPLNHLRDMFFRYIKVYKGGNVDPNTLTADVEFIAKRLQASIDGVFTKIFSSNGEITDQAAYNKLQVSAVNSQEIEGLIRADMTGLETRFGGLGKEQMASASGGAAGSPPPGGTGAAPGGGTP